MDLLELKKEQFKFAGKVVLRDNFNKIETIAGVDCVTAGDQLLAVVVVCKFPSMELKEKKSYLLSAPLPYRAGYEAYRFMPAMIEAVNLLEEEPDVLLVNGPGILHSRKLGIASHLGLSLNLPTVGITDNLSFGNIENGKILVNGNLTGFEVTTRKHSRPIYISPGHLISLGSVLNFVKQTICPPHKMPEPLHLAHKIAKKKVKKVQE